MWDVSSFVIRNKEEAALGPLITQIKQLHQSHSGGESLSGEQAAAVEFLRSAHVLSILFSLTLAAPSLCKATPLIWL